MHPRSLLAALSLLLLAQQSSATPGNTVLGCPCQLDCARTLNSLTATWCVTLGSPLNASLEGVCYARWSPALVAYWDWCVQNVTDVRPQNVLTSLSGMWNAMTWAAAGGTAAAYGVAACGATLGRGALSRRAALWLPLSAMAVGGCHGFCVGAVFALLLSFVYLGMPYAIDLSFAVALGVMLAALLAYAATGPQALSVAALVKTAPHASEYS